MLEDYLRSAFDEQHALAVSGLVEGRHKLVLRFERYGVDTRKRSLLSLPVHTELDREGVEGAFSRIAFYLPRAVLLEQLGVVAQQADPPHEREHRFIACGRSILFDLPGRRQWTGAHAHGAGLP